MVTPDIQIEVTVHFILRAKMRGEWRVTQARFIIKRLASRLRLTLFYNLIFLQKLP
jgi:hypothetical protein